MKYAALLVLLALAAVAEAGRNVLDTRSLLVWDQGKPEFCSGVHAHDECPEHFECMALDEKFCEEEEVCTKNGYDQDDCEKKEVCYEFYCREIPRYCDPWAKYDECEKKYGYQFECNELDEPVCTYKDDCKQVKTDKCKEYSYEDKCHYEQGPCKAYNQGKHCRTENVCVEFKQEKKCQQRKVCRAHKQERKCKCAQYNGYGKCVKYGEDCHYVQGACEDYGYEEYGCKYFPTEECYKYETKEVDCRLVNKDCKEYEQVQKCEKVRGDCKAYEYEEKCEQIEDVCHKGECGEKPAPPPEPVTYKPPHKPVTSKHSSKGDHGYGGYGNLGYYSH